MHHAGRNGDHSCVPFNLNNTSCGFMLKEVHWKGKHPINSVVDWQSHGTYPTGHNISAVDWGALHDSSFFLFLVNIDYDAKPKDFFTQELWGELPDRTSTTTFRSLNRNLYIIWNFRRIQPVWITSWTNKGTPNLHVWRHVSKPKPEFDHYIVVGRTFLLLPEENGERLNLHLSHGISEIFF